MATYIAFLRAINLGATRRFPKGDIVTATEAAGFGDVDTYINTGNVRFATTWRSRARIEAALENAYEAHIGFDVPAVVLTASEVAGVAAFGAALAHTGGQFVSFLKHDPAPDAIAALAERVGPGERLVVEGRAAHLLLGENYHTARLTNALVERHLGVATNRTLEVVRTLAERWT